MAFAPINPGVAVNPNYLGLHHPSFVTNVSVMSTGDRSFIFGAKSKRVDAEAGSFCIYHEVDVDGAKRCFGNIFTLTHLRPWYLNTNLVSPGDSGAWVLSTVGSVVAWDGMVFAGDGATAYACFAENILAEARTSISSSMILPP